MLNLSDRRNRLVAGRAFTLVELLVVIAIIALLISILLPSLARAREQAKSAKCLANLRDMMSSSVAYSMEDTSEYLIPVIATLANIDYQSPCKVSNWLGNHFPFPAALALGLFLLLIDLFLR